MRIALELQLTADQRSALFYALLMKDLGCSSNAARFSVLFGADDQRVKADLKTTDWPRAIEAFRFVARNVAPGQFWLKRTWQLLGVLSRGPAGARDVVLTRCERGADIARIWDSRTRPFRPFAPSMSTGTVQVSPTLSEATRFRSSHASSASRRPWRCSSAAMAWRRRTTWRCHAGAAGSIRISSMRFSPFDRTMSSGARWPTRTARHNSRGSSRRTRCWSRMRTASIGWPRHLPWSSTRSRHGPFSIRAASPRRVWRSRRSWAIRANRFARSGARRSCTISGSSVSRA